jgi:NAD(P)-dependent dehydrogenase (short-subunit alcohol dehydrogenase family)
MNDDYLKKLFCLDGKKAIVTGASQGIGRAIALSLANFGAEVALVGRQTDLLASVKAEIEEQGGVCETYAFDVSSQAAMNQFFDNYIEKHGHLDIFINNAGYSKMSRVLEVSEEDMQGLLSTNFKGAVYGIQRAGQIMKQQRSGNIVIVTSVNAHYPLPIQAIYSCTKSALETLARCLASDLCRYNVRVNTFAPGAVNTRMNKNMFENPDIRREIDDLIPIGYVAEPEDVGDAVTCMVSDAFKYMTGSTVIADGGIMLQFRKEEPR